MFSASLFFVRLLTCPVPMPPTPITPMRMRSFAPIARSRAGAPKTTAPPARTDVLRKVRRFVEEGFIHLFQAPFRRNTRIYVGQQSNLHHTRRQHDAEQREKKRSGSGSAVTQGTTRCGEIEVLRIPSTDQPGHPLLMLR